MNGKVKIFYIDGSHYQGNFQNDKKDGPGDFVDKDGQAFQELYHAGLLISTTKNTSHLQIQDQDQHFHSILSTNPAVQI